MRRILAGEVPDGYATLDQYLARRRHEGHLPRANTAPPAAGGASRAAVGITRTAKPMPEEHRDRLRALVEGSCLPVAGSGAESGELVEVAERAPELVNSGLARR